MTSTATMTFAECNRMDRSNSNGERYVEGFSRLIPKVHASATDPVQTAIVAAATKIFECALAAYKNPTVKGFTNGTTKGNKVQYLN